MKLWKYQEKPGRPEKIIYEKYLSKLQIKNYTFNDRKIKMFSMAKHSKNVRKKAKEIGKYM